MAGEEEKKGFSVVDRRVKWAEDDAAEGTRKGASEKEEKPTSGGEKSKGHSAPSSPPSESAPQSPAELSFPAFLLSLHASALIHLGILPGPGGEEKKVNLELARQNIDLLAVLEEKTRGNLSEDEGQLLANILYELRMTYLQVCQSQGGGKECKL